MKNVRSPSSHLDFSCKPELYGTLPWCPVYPFIRTRCERSRKALVILWCWYFQKPSVGWYLFSKTTFRVTFPPSFCHGFNKAPHWDPYFIMEALATKVVLKTQYHIKKKRNTEECAWDVLTQRMAPVPDSVVFVDPRGLRDVWLQSRRQQYRQMRRHRGMCDIDFALSR